MPKEIRDSQEVLVLGLLESEIFKGDIRPNLCVCLCVCPLFNPGRKLVKIAKRAACNLYIA